MISASGPFASRKPVDAPLHPMVGGLAGGVSTAAMTAAMFAMHRRLPAGQRYRLPPEHIVTELLERWGAHRHLTRDQMRILSLVAHHGYGAALGTLFSALAPRGRWSSVVGGVGLGLAVWAASYLGWLPALEMEASATEEPRERNAMMIAAHAVWGAATGALFHTMSKAR